MTTIEQAIEKFRASRLAVYLADQDELIRNANSAAETAQDHVGRWIYELIQNSDDAQAKKLLIKVTERAIYVADNGNGLKPETIKSLSGTHLSVKPAGCIGRKGLGFKSVYAISSSPQIFSEQDGMIFCPDKALAWIREYELPDSKIPYQWLPFWISRSAVSNSDSALAGMKDFRTVVKLPIIGNESVQQAVESLGLLPAYALLTFRNLNEIEVDAGDKSFSILVEEPREGKAWWTIADSPIDSANRCVKRDGSIQRVRRWYEAALESVSVQESTESLANAPLLCRRGEEWKYVTNESRWLSVDVRRCSKRQI